MYHNGDRVRWLPNGNVEFLGRLDDQVKVNGYRIELDEVQSALLQCPGIRAAAVVAPSGPRGRTLAAFYVPTAGPLAKAEIAGALQTILPSYMVPRTSSHSTRCRRRTRARSTVPPSCAGSREPNLRSERHGDEPQHRKDLAARSADRRGGRGRNRRRPRPGSRRPFARYPAGISRRRVARRSRHSERGRRHQRPQRHRGCDRIARHRGEPRVHHEPTFPGRPAVRPHAVRAAQAKPAYSRNRTRSPNRTAREGSSGTRGVCARDGQGIPKYR
ncbi:AMP-binding enzyme [Lentzea flava]|uniref:AMP-binding enzyme n=1 Tax=Lentzea flava TaxID=103732 RepID=UPI0034D51DFC